MSLLIKARHSDEDVIDLTERLAPYADVAWTPRSARTTPDPPPDPAAPVWEPLELVMEPLLDDVEPPIEDIEPQIDDAATGELLEVPEVDPAPSAQVVPALPKQSRNQPCACGSGKKFKRCCGDASRPRHLR